MAMPSWSDDRVEQLKQLRNEGLSCALIAARLGGVTRNAVIGKLHRLGLTSNPLVTQRYRSKGAKSGLATMRSRIYAAGLKKIHGKYYDPAKIKAKFKTDSYPEPLPLPLPAETDIPRVAFADLTDNQCKWIVGDVRPKAMCCGADRVPGHPYCEHHLVRAWEHSKHSRKPQHYRFILRSLGGPGGTAEQLPGVDKELANVPL